MEHVIKLSTPQFRGHNFCLIAYDIMSRNQASRQAMISTVHAPELKIDRTILAAAARHQESVADARRRNAPEPAESIEWSEHPRAQDARTFLRSMKTSAGMMEHTAEAARKARVRAFAMNHWLGKASLWITINPDTNGCVLLNFFTADANGDQQQQPYISRRINAARSAHAPGAEARACQIIIDTIFTVLFGWDFKAQRARPGGGIFGTLVLCPFLMLSSVLTSVLCSEVGWAP